MLLVLRKLAAYPPQLLLYLFGLIVPRSRAIWVFGAWFGHRYADNSRYVFEYVNEYQPEIRAVWLTRAPTIVAQLLSILRRWPIAPSGQ